MSLSSNLANSAMAAEALCELVMKMISEPGRAAEVESETAADMLVAGLRMMERAARFQFGIFSGGRD